MAEPQATPTGAAGVAPPPLRPRPPPEDRERSLSPGTEIEAEPVGILLVAVREKQLSLDRCHRAAATEAEKP
jgi:hypothetical protein